MRNSRSRAWEQCRTVLSPNAMVYTSPSFMEEAFAKDDGSTRCLSQEVRGLGVQTLEGFRRNGSS